MDKIEEIIALILIITALGGVIYVERDYSIEQAKKTAVASLKSKYDILLKEEAKKAEDIENYLKEQNQISLKERDAKIKNLSSSTDMLVSELRKLRASRPKEIPTITKSTTACTGRELYGEDAEFLTREAARADKIIIDRDFYYNAYEKARKELNGN